MKIISVTPTEAGWTLKSDRLSVDVPFSSGAYAEAAARELGQQLADEGVHAEVRIYLRDGTLGGRFVCAPFAPVYEAPAPAKGRPSRR